MSDFGDRPVMSAGERAARLRHPSGRGRLSERDIEALVDEEFAKMGDLTSVSFLGGDEVVVEYGNPGDVTVTYRVEVVVGGQIVEVTLERNGRVGTLMVSAVVDGADRGSKAPNVFASVQSPSLRSGRSS
ncbi:hypothetical protein R3Q06_11100 [Rhodococcus erythropolis]|uniref:hypothetical protein n=1 Tax=Rhodococcus erythropolis TaxID=1833 RepID=UPI00294A8DE8|nr:hypothetical protein [Rhodococcus erythropolis]MDV6274046.1 hypothetical protein [Rhodococcus erythropolis]